MGMALGIVSTVAGIAQQASAAGAQREQIAAQSRAAEQTYQLQKQRFEYARNDAAQMYQREALVAEEMRRNAMTQWEMANVQQRTADIYTQTEENIQDTTLKNRVTQLMATANSSRGQAAVSNAQMYQQLVRSMGGNEAAANRFLQNVMAMGADSSSADQVRQRSVLATIAAMQNTQEAANTNTRVAGAQGEALEAEANQTEAYRKLTRQFLDSQRGIQSQFRDSVNTLMPSILDLQHQRNMVSLNTASFARQAELSMGQESSLIQRGLNQSTANAQMRATPSFGGIFLQGLAGIGSQVIPHILHNRSSSPSTMNQTNGYSNQYPVLQFGQRLPSNTDYSFEWGQPLPSRTRSYQDVTGNIYG